MPDLHPKVKEIGLKLQLADLEAEQVLRGMAASGDETAKKIVADIDNQREQTRQRRLLANKEIAKRLGLSLDQIPRFVQRLVDDVEVFTWLCRRVNLTRAHERPLRDDE